MVAKIVCAIRTALSVESASVTATRASACADLTCKVGGAINASATRTCSNRRTTSVVWIVTAMSADRSALNVTNSPVSVDANPESRAEAVPIPSKAITSPRCISSSMKPRTGSIRRAHRLALDMTKNSSQAIRGEAMLPSVTCKRKYSRTFPSQSSAFIESLSTMSISTLSQSVPCSSLLLMNG